MVPRNRLVLFLLLFILVVVALFFLFRQPTQAAFGPAVALCPGPDAYGYTCASGSGFAYIDATHDTFLYEDDGIIQLELPFPFTFYGTTYTAVYASVNGNLQFNNNNASFANDCLTNGPLLAMGDMIAPYYDDLDLRLFGYLETEVVGTEPNRIFVVEWDDIPRYGDYADDLVTFEVQLWEGSNHMVVLYEDVTTFDGYNGSSATIGLQSEAQGLTLQYGCNQPVIADASRIFFPFPAEANPEIGQTLPEEAAGNESVSLVAKGAVLELIQAINQSGTAVLPQLRTHWLSQNPPRSSEWQQADLNGDGRSELILLWHSTIQYPGLSQIVILTTDEAGTTSLLFDHTFSSRTETFPAVEFVTLTDLTRDRMPDVLIKTLPAQQLFVISAVHGNPELFSIPERCEGSLRMQNDVIVRDGCQAAGWVMSGWNGQEFTILK